MIKRTLRRSALALLLLVLPFATRAAEPVSPEQKAAIEQIIHDYLLSHPDLLAEVLKEVKEGEEAKAAVAAHDVLVAQHDALFSDPRSPVGGNPKGDVTLVEFFDYSCPYCKQVEPALEALLREDPKLKIVYKEFPILGPPSVTASRVALASVKQSKYDAFHRAMIATKGQITDEVVVRVARSVGLDMEQLRVDMAAPEVEAFIKSDYALAQALNIRATPVFVLGDAVLPGVIDLDMLRRLIANQRLHDE